MLLLETNRTKTKNRKRKQKMSEKREQVFIGGIVDKPLVDRLDAIANKALRSRAKEIQLAITAYVEMKEQEKKND